MIGSFSYVGTRTVVTTVSNRIPFLAALRRGTDTSLIGGIQEARFKEFQFLYTFNLNLGNW